MLVPTEETVKCLAAIPNLQVSLNEPLSRHTRFAIGGPAAVFAETADERALLDAARVVRNSGQAYVVVGGGTNLIVSDAGFDGIVLRYSAAAMRTNGCVVIVDAGATLQDLVDFTVSHGLAGLETLAGIPGWAGAAVYGNAGAYGHSISEVVTEVRFFDGSGVCTLNREQCEFRYRDSVFKRHKNWLILAARLELQPGDRAELQKKAGEIVDTRNRKFPPTMKCAGSIFKNFLLAELPEPVRGALPEKTAIEGKVPAGYFLEQAGAKGMREGGIHVADYHANLIYNDGTGSARDLTLLIAELKRRVWERFGVELEEEVQYVGRFED